MFRISGSGIYFCLFHCSLMFFMVWASEVLAQSGYDQIIYENTLANHENFSEQKPIAANATNQNSEISALKIRVEEYQAQLVKLKEKLSKKSGVYEELRITIVRQAKIIEKLNNKLVKSDKIEEERDNALVKLDEILARLAKLRKKSKQVDAILLVKKLENKLRESEKAEQECRQITSELMTIKNFAVNLKKQLRVAKNELLLKDTEIKRLAALAGTKPRLRDSISVSSSKKDSTVSASSQSASLASESPIAKVVGDKVNLRAGPGTKHGVLMQVTKGTRLMVEASVGEWFQVITPTGGRAYVHKKMITINDLNVPVMSQPSVKLRKQPSRTSKRPRKVKDEVEVDEAAFDYLLKGFGSR